MLNEYHVIDSVRYYPRLHVTAVGLGTYYPWIRLSACTVLLSLNIRLGCVSSNGVYVYCRFGENRWTSWVVGRGNCWGEHLDVGERNTVEKFVVAKRVIICTRDQYSMVTKSRTVCMVDVMCGTHREQSVNWRKVFRRNTKKIIYMTH